MALLFLTSDGKLIMNSSKQVYTEAPGGSTPTATPLDAYEGGDSYTFASGDTVHINVVDGYHDHCYIQFSANFDLALLVNVGDGSGGTSYHYGMNEYMYDINETYIPGGDELSFTIYDYDIYSSSSFPWGDGQDCAYFIQQHGRKVGTLKVVELTPGNTGPDWRAFGFVEQ